MNNILKQTIANMRQQPLLTGLTIAGTALAICLIMVVIMTREAKIVDYGCEPNRSRTLYASNAHISGPGERHYFGSLDNKATCGVFMGLKTPESVAIYNIRKQSVMAPGHEETREYVKLVNADFFNVFSLDFIEGRGFSKEECRSNAPVAILTRRACRRIFATEENVTGRTLFIFNHEYRVAGVVREVSSIQTSAHSEIWLPFNPAMADGHPLAKSGQPTGDNCIAILAKDKEDFKEIRNEIARRLATYNKSIAPDTLDLMGQPDDQETAVSRTYSNEIPDMGQIYRRYLIVFAILLIVPAINIASMTQSRLRQRIAEIGVRRAFGARRNTILRQAVLESLIQTVAGGIIGFVMCMALYYFACDYIFEQSWFDSTQSKTLDMRILLSPKIYGWVMLFCFLLNTLSSTIPAWRASRGNIVEALK